MASSRQFADGRPAVIHSRSAQDTACHPPTAGTVEAVTFIEVVVHNVAAKPVGMLKTSSSENSRRKIAYAKSAVSHVQAG